MEANYAREEHHGVGERESRGEEGGGCEDVGDVVVADPRSVEFFGVHVGVHAILFLVEVVDGLEKVVVELGQFDYLLRI